MSSAQTVRRTRSAGLFKELQLKNDRLELTLLPGLGCHWTRLRISVKGDWVDFLAPVPSPAALRKRPTGSGSYILAPWSNRIARAAFEFQGERFALRENFPDGTAIHGDARTRPWRVERQTDSRFEALLDSREFPDFNFPFALLFKHSLELLGDSLRVELQLENVDRRSAPVGLGFHPFARRRLTRRDKDVILVVPAEKVYPARRCLPTGPPKCVTGRTDLRSFKLLGAPNLDHCFTSLAGETLRLIYPGTGVEVRFELEPVFTHAVVYAPNDEEGKPRDFVAVEPVTNVNDGFNLLARGWPGTGVKILDPGESWGGAWTLSAGDI